MENNNRTPVYSYCPYCGAQQDIDPARDVAYCRYCGKPSPVSKTISGTQDRRQTLPGPDGAPIPVYPQESDPLEKDIDLFLSLPFEETQVGTFFF